MIAPLAKFIDWYFLQVAAMLPSIRKCARGDSKLTEAVEFLNGPNFIPAKSSPTDLEFNWRFPKGHFAICCGFVPDLPERILAIDATTVHAKTMGCLQLAAPGRASDSCSAARFAVCAAWLSLIHVRRVRGRI